MSAVPPLRRDERAEQPDIRGGRGSVGQVADPVVEGALGEGADGEQVAPWLPTYLATDRDIPTGTVAVFMTVLNLGMFVGYNVFGLIADCIGRRSAIIFSLLGVAVTLPLFALTSNQTALLWFGPLFAFFALAAVAGVIGLSGGLLVCAVVFAAAGLLTFLLRSTEVPAAIPERTA